jgi:hypothetical protein
LNFISFNFMALFLLWLERGTFTTNFMFIIGIYMFNKVTKLLVTIALTGWMGVANATLIFDFSWDSSNGKIIGEIYGLSNDGVNMEATGLVLTSVGGMQVNVDVFEYGHWFVINNLFDVLDGELIGFNFWADSFSGINGYRYLRLKKDTSNNSSQFNDGLSNYNVDSDGASFVKRVTVPEPSSVILMLLGLAGLSFARYRKQY